MSYDLLVFDPLAAPPDREGFLRWYAEQVTWHEGHSYDDPEVSTPALQAWYPEMRSKFPALNGPFASDDVDNPRITDYSVGKSVIYAAFRWDEAGSARTATFDLAKKHGVGFF